LRFCVGLSFCCSSELFLTRHCHFAWLCCFLCPLLALAGFLLVDDLLELFWLFWSSSCASWGLDSNFKLCTFVVNGPIKGEIEKSSGQFLVLIVMSH
jgi:hypothetical protein